MSDQAKAWYHLIDYNCDTDRGGMCRIKGRISFPPRISYESTRFHSNLQQLWDWEVTVVQRRSYSTFRGIWGLETPNDRLGRFQGANRSKISACYKSNSNVFRIFATSSRISNKKRLPCASWSGLLGSVLFSKGWILTTTGWPGSRVRIVPKISACACDDFDILFSQLAHSRRQRQNLSTWACWLGFDCSVLFYKSWRLATSSSIGESNLSPVQPNVLST